MQSVITTYLNAPSRRSILANAVMFAVPVIGLSFQAGCSRRPKKMGSSVVNMGNRTSAFQLISGFYMIEDGRYRWTMKDFSVALALPPASDKNGARLLLTLFVPKQHINLLGPITLQAEMNGVQLQPQTFTKDGEFTYIRDVPPSAARTHLLPVRFTLNKAAAPTKTEDRELGIVVTRAALEPK